MIAAENTVERERKLRLPAAQLVHFLLRTALGDPTLDQELSILDDQLHGNLLARLQPVVSVDALRDAFAAVEDFYDDTLLTRWAVELVPATRTLELIDLGASVTGQHRARAGCARWNV